MIHHHLHHPPLPAINAAVESSYENSFPGICCPQQRHLGLDFSNYPCSTDEEAGAYLRKEANAFSLEVWLVSFVFLCAHCQAPLPHSLLQSLQLPCCPWTGRPAFPLTGCANVGESLTPAVPPFPHLNLP